MAELAPGGPSGGLHLMNDSHPKMPDLAWTEGFAWAFAGQVTKPEWSGLLRYRCGPKMNFIEIALFQNRANVVPSGRHSANLRIQEFKPESLEIVWDRYIYG
jgi:hypothetical protein